MSEVQMDDIDRDLIRILQADGRTSYSQLSRVVGLSDAACRQRVKRLLDTGVIDVVAVSDPIKIGLGHGSLLGINIIGDIRKVANDVGLLDDAVYVVITTGRFDLMVEIVTRDDESFIDVTNVIRMMDGVTHVESMRYLDITKQTYDWGVG